MPLSTEPGNGEGMHLPHAKLGWNPLDFLVRVHAFHRGNDSPGREQVFDPCDDFGDFRESAGNDAIELTRRPPRLEALAHHARILESKLCNRLPQKSALLVIAVEQVDLNVRPGHG